MTHFAPAVDAQLTVEAKGLTKRFGRREVLSDVSFAIPRGQGFGLLGPNGSGKTTTIRILTGLLTPDHGEVTLFGEKVTAKSSDRLRARIGVQSDSNLYETLTARENLRIWGDLYGIPKKKRDARIDELFDILDLSNRADSRAGEFSKGMRQKLAIARAIIHEPDLLFLDEPTASLDPESSADLLSHLSHMIQNLNTTVLICTHQLHGLEKLCDSIGIIKQGHLVTSGPVESLLRHRWPRSKYLVSFAGDETQAQRIAQEAQNTELTASADGELTVLTDDENDISALISALVQSGISVRTVVPQKPTVEQFYFASLAEGTS